MIVCLAESPFVVSADAISAYEAWHTELIVRLPYGRKVEEFKDYRSYFQIYSSMESVYHGWNCCWVLFALLICYRKYPRHIKHIFLCSWLDKDEYF